MAAEVADSNKGMAAFGVLQTNDGDLGNQERPPIFEKNNGEKENEGNPKQNPPTRNSHRSIIR
eukprot:scaffold1036_cov93-Cylindrotheca_fusiformis.AAC.4